MNTMYWRNLNSEAPTQENTDILFSALIAFYQMGWDNLPFPGMPGGSFASVLSNVVNGVGSTIKGYNYSLPKPRTPVATRTFQLALPGPESLPEEVAICLSYEARPFLQGVNPAKSKGRIFLGPISRAMLGTGAGGMSSIRDIVRAKILQSYASLITSALVSRYEPVVITPNGFEGAQTITRAWVDDAWDTQRRRGGKPTVKDYVSV